MLTESGADFVLELLGVRLDETERLWFFSDWLSVVPRTFEERLHDVGVSRRECVRVHSFDVDPSMTWSQFVQAVR